MPGALLALVIATGYLPGHAPGAPIVAEVVALVAALYATGIVVAAPRFANSAVLRLGGRPFRVVLLGRTGDDLDDAATAARWRFLAVAAGASITLVLMAAAAALVMRGSPDGYPHAIAEIIASIAFLNAIGTIVPIPRFAGWSLLLAAIDAVGVPRRARARLAAWVARLVATPLILVASLVGATIDPFVSLSLAILVVAYLWRATALVMGRDALAMFLEAHRVGELVRPAIARARPADVVPAEGWGTGGVRGAVFVERDSFLVGAIGTHRLGRIAGDLAAGRTRWSDVMVPVAHIRWLHVDDPATRVVEALRPGGVALVIVGDEIRAVEEDDLFDQAVAWGRDRDHPRAEPGGGRTPDPGPDDEGASRDA